MTVALPAALQTGTVKWTVVAIAEDSVDAGSAPDPEQITGTVSFTPIIDNNIIKYIGDASNAPVSVLTRTEIYSVVAGVMVDKSGSAAVQLIANNTPLTSPQNWNYEVSYNLNNGYSLGSFEFALPAGATVDLSTVIPQQDPSTGVLYVTGPRGADGAAGATGPQGPQGPTGPTGASGTIASATATGLAAGASPTVTLGGTPSARTMAFGIPAGATGPQGPAGAGAADATTTSKGSVQLAGDLAGTAAAPTVPGLAGKAAASHTHGVADLTATGTKSATTFLRGDNTWAVPAGGAAATAGMGVTNVKDYGATGDGTTDDTTAINNAFAAAASANVVYFPPGSYVYNGTGHDTFRPRIVGAGYGASTILLGATSYLINSSKVISSTILMGLRITGGLGALRYTNAATNSSEIHVVRDCYFDGYTRCAISHNATDMPDWKIENNLFNAANDTAAIGIALGGLPNMSVIRANAFWTNRIHIKVRNGQDLKIRDNHFMRYNAGTGTSRVDLWLVPLAATNNAYTGLEVVGNKFGNENLATGDYRILIADELTGAENSLMLPNLAANSTGYVHDAKFDNMVYGTSPAPLPMIYTTTPNFFNNELKYNAGGSTPPTYLVQYRTNPGTAQGNKFTVDPDGVPLSNATTPTNLNPTEALKIHDGSTGGGTRPTGGYRVRWVGGTVRPTNMVTGDVWEHS